MTEMVKACLWAGFVFDEQSQLNDVVEFSIKHNYVTESRVRDFSTDGWKRTLRLAVGKRADVTTITIYAEGEDLFAHTGTVAKAYLLLKVKGKDVISATMQVPD